MKIISSHLSLEKEKGKNPSDGPKAGKSEDFRRVLELARFAAAQARRDVPCVGLHCELLKQGGETPERLRALSDRHFSSAFSKREQEALRLSRAVSLQQGNKALGAALSEACLHFTVSEMIDLVLAIMSTNDWLDFRAVELKPPFRNFSMKASRHVR